MVLIAQEACGNALEVRRSLVGGLRLDRLEHRRRDIHGDHPRAGRRGLDREGSGPGAEVDQRARRAEAA
jgi:hypothetical protein